MADPKMFVSNKDESPRMFRNNFLDFFSRVHFTVPLAIYLPLVLFFLYRGLVVFEVPVWTAVPLFVGAVVLWTLVEYIMHRFIFHYEPSSEVGKRIHFMAHGVHHDYPNDHLRLVMPPAASLPLALGFYGLFWLALGAAWAQPFMAGFVAGYLYYDMAHYAMHHLRWDNPLFKTLQKHHLAHHFRNPDRGYSVSVVVWDKVFGTFGGNRKRGA